MFAPYWYPYLSIASPSQGLAFKQVAFSAIPGCNGVPQVLVTPAGNLYLYYQTANGICRAITYDGIHWMPESNLVLLKDIADVGIVYLSGGRGYRFICDPDKSKVKYDLFQSWYTRDGREFQYEGICGPINRINGNWCDVPHVVWLGGRTWRLYYIGGRGFINLVIRTALSHDEGKTFTYEGVANCMPKTVQWEKLGLPYYPVDPTVLYMDGGFRLYYMYAMHTIHASDGYDGITFGTDTIVAKQNSPNFYDPVVVRIPKSGKYYLYYGVPGSGIVTMESS